MELAAAIAANGNQADIRIPFKALPGVAQNNIGKLRLFIDQMMNLFALVEAVVEVILGGSQCVAENFNRIAVFNIVEKALLIEKQRCGIGF